MTPLILNKHRSGIPRNAVYIGRGSDWGNPFEIGKDGDRAEVIEKYRNWLRGQNDLLSRIEPELKNKNLVCYCAPKACHGDILLAIANGADPSTVLAPRQIEVQPTLF